jgi:hypothetical protein
MNMKMPTASGEEPRRPRGYHSPLMGTGEPPLYAR